MSTNLISSGTTAREKVNLRTPDVMAAVQQQVESHYRSDIVDKVRRQGGIISVGDTTVRLAKQFGFCYGVERAIDLAYAARKVFKDRRLFIVGEIIHNPEVNEQISSLGIKNLTGQTNRPTFPICSRTTLSSCRHLERSCRSNNKSRTAAARSSTRPAATS